MIKDTVKVAQKSLKMQKSRLNWYGHAIRRDKNYVGRRITTMKVKGQRRRVNQSSDVQVKKQYKGKGIARKLDDG